MTKIPGEYLASADKVAEDTGDFDLRQKVVYPKIEKDDPDVITNESLTMFRCTWCHDCGFNAAWDVEHFGKETWEPQYRGDQWRPIVKRMQARDDTMLNAELSSRIYEFLCDESLSSIDHIQSVSPRKADN